MLLELTEINKMCTKFDLSDLENAKKFLSSFIAQYEDSDTDTCPLRVKCFSMNKDEVDGEISDILLRFLEKKCQHQLTACIVNECIKKFREKDYEEFVMDGADTDETQYNAKLMSEALFQVLLDICKIWNSDLPTDVLLKNSLSLDVYVHSIKNKRRKMEDRFVSMPHINVMFGCSEKAESEALFGVFDGHGGTDAADYAASQLASNLKRSGGPCDPVDALHDAFVRTDSQFVTKGVREKLRSGATAAVAYIVDSNLHIAWVGDSQIVLSKNATAFQVMDPHKPNRDDERKRIEELGGCVVFFGGWRVNGSLAVSRAIGDYEQKPYISGEPDIESYEMEGDEEFLILACDGLWDVVDPQAAVDNVHNNLVSGTRHMAAEKLVELAVSLGSMDNVTVMVVYFDCFNADQGTGHTLPEEEVSSS